jgi:hypothetical protein
VRGGGRLGGPAEGGGSGRGAVRRGCRRADRSEQRARARLARSSERFGPRQPRAGTPPRGATSAARSGLAAAAERRAQRAARGRGCLGALNGRRAPIRAPRSCGAPVRPAARTDGPGTAAKPRVAGRGCAPAVATVEQRRVEAANVLARRCGLFRLRRRAVVEGGSHWRRGSGAVLGVGRAPRRRSLFFHNASTWRGLRHRGQELSRYIQIASKKAGASGPGHPLRPSRDGRRPGSDRRAAGAPAPPRGRPPRAAAPRPRCAAASRRRP